MNTFVDSFYDDFPKIRSLIIPFFLGSVTWIIMFFQIYLIVLGLGVSIPFIAFILLYPVANTAGFIPISLAGLGTRELTAIIIFSSLYAVSQEQVFVFTLVGFLVTDALTGLFGFILSLSEARKKKNIRYS